jgi:hypothetical protein
MRVCELALDTASPARAKTRAHAHAHFADVRGLRGGPRPPAAAAPSPAALSSWGLPAAYKLRIRPSTGFGIRPGFDRRDSTESRRRDSTRRDSTGGIRPAGFRPGGIPTGVRPVYKLRIRDSTDSTAACCSSSTACCCAEQPGGCRLCISTRIAVYIDPIAVYIDPISTRLCI